MKDAWRSLPGLALAVSVAAVALVSARFMPPAIGPVLLAVALGLLAANLLTLHAGTRPGLRVASNQLLRIGVVLLGARLTFADVASIGGPAVGAVIVTMSTAFATVFVASRVFGVDPRLATLIGVGTAVCGNSAIAATAPVIEADGREVGFAVATITAFGIVGLLAFPIVASMTEMPDQVFGIWAGLAINDTSQVVAAGAAYSDESLEVATVVKLVRNAFMAPLILLVAWWQPRHAAATTGAGDAVVRRSVLQAFPLFLLGFLALAGLRSLGVLGDDFAAASGTVSTWLITIAIAAIGLSTRFADLRKVGAVPFLVGLGASLVLAGIGLGLAMWLGG